MKRQQGGAGFLTALGLVFESFMTDIRIESYSWSAKDCTVELIVMINSQMAHGCTRRLEFLRSNSIGSS